MSAFVRRYREPSRRSRIAFWLVMVPAGSSITITAIGVDGGHRPTTLTTLRGVCTLVMVVPLAVLWVGQIIERRPPR